MDYILTGNDKDVANVLQEQRIRIDRGVISFIPVSECRIITEEDARNTLEEKLAEKDAVIGELAASIAEKDNEIDTLTKESNSMKARITELEALVATDNKNLPASDVKDLPAGDSKEVATGDNKEVAPADEKKTGKAKSDK